MERDPKRNDNIQCKKCGYCNHKHYVEQTGKCHLCGNILDEKAYFKLQMRKKLRLWRGKRQDGNSWWNTL